MNYTELAIDKMKRGAACSQAIFSVFAPQFGLDEKIAHRCSVGFGGGFGKKQLVCGAFSGGVLGLIHGNEVPEDIEGKRKSYEAVHDFMTAMEKEFGAVTCKDIMGVDFRDPGAQEKVKDERIIEKVCHPCVQRVVEYIEKYITR